MSRQTDWLLEGDIAIQYLTYRDLLHASKEQCDALQARLPQEGICARLLSCQRADEHWGLHYYQPKWTSTHYTLLLLKEIGAPPALDAQTLTLADRLAADASVLAPLGLVMRKTEPRSAIAEKCFAEARKLFGKGQA